MQIPSKPYVRWWWLGGPFVESDILDQLEWIKRNGFGGVELAWLYPAWLDESQRRHIPEWLGPEWSRLTAFTKVTADSLGLGCDFTFGSAWPFGGRCVPREQSSRTLEGEVTGYLHASWEDAHVGAVGHIVDHLSAESLRNYSKHLARSFGPALEGGQTSLFCDSFEIDKRKLWSPRLTEEFKDKYGYSVANIVKNFHDPRTRYDYKTFVGEAMVREFYATFTDICHELGAVSRVQCHGAPVDLLSAYGAVDIPESEALLFEPHFSRIPASAAALHGKPIVSCETFTCIYGFPAGKTADCAQYTRRENIADLKLLADALFANGINHIVWHGMPYVPADGRHEFYASVHVGPNCVFREHLPAFNRYLTHISAAMREGTPYGQLAIYLPNEDCLLRGDLPPDERIPGEQDYWEMRGLKIPKETEGYHPLWVSGSTLKMARVEHERLVFPGVSMDALYIDVEWLDADALREILRLGQLGLPIVLLRKPSQPGSLKVRDYDENLEELVGLRNVVNRLRSLPLRPLVKGRRLPAFWARKTEDGLLLFLAHPAAREVRYPLAYGQSAQATNTSRKIQITFNGRSHKLKLTFGPFESILLRIHNDGTVNQENVSYTPPYPCV